MSSNRAASKDSQDQVLNVHYEETLEITKTWWLPHGRFLQHVVYILFNSVSDCLDFGMYSMPRDVAFVPSFMLVIPGVGGVVAALGHETGFAISILS